MAGVGVLREAPNPSCGADPSRWFSPPKGRHSDVILITLPKQPNGTPGKKPPAPSVTTRRPMEPDIEAQIAQQIFAVLQRSGEEPELLSIISHWWDTLDDREVF
jgi:hypothetical protein